MKIQENPILLRAPTMTVSYALPPDWRFDPRPPLQRGRYPLFRHALLDEKAQVGMVAISALRGLEDSWSDEEFLTFVAVEGKITGIEKRLSPFEGGAVKGTRWAVEFKLDSAPFQAEIYSLRSTENADSPSIYVSCWGPADNLNPAGQIALSLQPRKSMNQTRKKGLFRLAAGAALTFAGIALTAATYDAATGAGAGEYLVFYGLVIVGIIVFLQGIWKLVVGRGD